MKEKGKLSGDMEDEDITRLIQEEESESTGQPQDGSRQENKMGVLPVKRLLVSMSLPMMISMLVQALYNIVDSVFVAQIEEKALTAVTLAFPMQNFMISVAAGTGVGINALLSRSLGEKRFDRADHAANSGIFVILMSAVAFLLIGLFGTEPFIMSQNEDPVIFEYAKTYLGIVTCVSLPLFMQITFERLLQSTGRTFFSMISQVTGAVRVEFYSQQNTQKVEYRRHNHGELRTHRAGIDNGCHGVGCVMETIDGFVEQHKSQCKQ